MEHHLTIEDDTHKSLVAKGSIPNPHYKRVSNRAERTVEHTNHIPESLVEVQTKDDNKVWESCCLRLSPKCIIYTGQYTISILVLGICTYMLIQANGSCEQSSGYINLIAFLLGKLLATVATSA